MRCNHSVCCGWNRLQRQIGLHLKLGVRLLGWVCLAGPGDIENAGTA